MALDAPPSGWRHSPLVRHYWPVAALAVVGLFLIVLLFFTGRESEEPWREVLRSTDPLFGPPRGELSAVADCAAETDAARQAEVRAYAAEIYRLAPLAGLDPAVAIAQSAHETGFWRSAAWRDHLNPAGIGITGPDTPSPTWTNGADAARGQLVHLYLYAVGPVPPDHVLAPFLDLDPRYQPALSAGRASVAPTLADLTGRWATDPNYAAGVVRAGNEVFNRRCD